jgi:hypothetical protein
MSEEAKTQLPAELLENLKELANLVSAEEFVKIATEQYNIVRLVEPDQDTNTGQEAIEPEVTAATDELAQIIAARRAMRKLRNNF